VLALVAAGIGYESLVRLFQPVTIRYDEALAIAVLGLAVNLVSAWLLRGDHHAHAHDHGDHHHHHHDHNLRSAYWHVMADALTSVLAIVGLLAARFHGWTWLDPVMGIVGALIIAHWAWGLMRSSGAVLLDVTAQEPLVEAIRRRLERGDDRVADLHVWRVGPGHFAAIVSLVSDAPQPVEHYKARLGGLDALSHVTVEVHHCAGPH
jgi:cation diffusion facilitator family transporter